MCYRSILKEGFGIISIDSAHIDKRPAPAVHVNLHDLRWQRRSTRV